MFTQKLQILKEKQQQISQIKKEISYEISSKLIDFQDYYYYQIDEQVKQNEIHIWLSIYIPDPKANDNSFFELSISGTANFNDNFLENININLLYGNNGNEKTILLMYGKEIKEFAKLTEDLEDLFPGLDSTDFQRELYDKKECFKHSVYDISFMDFLSLVSEAHIKPYLKREGVYKETDLDKKNIDCIDFLKIYERKIPFLFKSFLEKKYIHEDVSDIVGDNVFKEAIGAIEQQEKKKYFKDLDIKIKEKEILTKSVKI